MTSIEISTPRLQEPEASYAQQLPFSRDQRNGLIRVRLAESGDRTTEHGCFDLLVAVCCPCVSTAQIASSIGCSYFVTLIVFALIYLTGLGFLLKSVMEYTEYDLNEEVVFYAIGLEFAAYLVGPYISLPTVGYVWFWHSLADGLEDTDRIRIIAPAVYYYACVDGWLDVAFVLAAAYIRDNLRERVNAPERRCCQHCLNTCCIWATLAKGVSSAKSYANDYGPCDVGPLDVTPAYEGSRM